MSETPVIELTHERVAELLLSKRWIFAKTMPLCPHWYTLRKEWGDEAEFEAVVQFMRDHGYDEMFGRRTMRRYASPHLGDFKFWSMGAPLDQTILINTAHLDNGPGDPPN